MVLVGRGGDSAGSVARDGHQEDLVIADDRLMNVVEFPIDVALTDVSGRLRKLADDIESGKQPARIAIVVLVDNEDSTAVLGYGEIGQSTEALGWMVRAMRDI